MLLMKHIIKYNTVLCNCKYVTFIYNFSMCYSLSVSVYVCLCLSVCLSVSLSLSLSVSVSLSLSLSGWGNGGGGMCVRTGMDENLFYATGSKRVCVGGSVVWGEVVHTEAADLFACCLNKCLSSSNPVLPQRVEKH